MLLQYFLRVLAVAASTHALSPTLLTSVPIASQALPVARSGAPFAFTLSPYTFAVAPLVDPRVFPALTYTTTLPPWATFDPATLTISGTPPADAPAAFSARIAAGLALPALANSTSPTLLALRASDDFTLRVLPPVVELGVPLADQLCTGGSARVSGATPLPAGAPTGVRIPPGWSFSIGLDPHTFESHAGAVPAYSAGVVVDTADTTTAPLLPLPSWLVFSPTAFTFSGVAPTMPSTRSYNVVLVAAGVQDARDAEITFVLVVASADGELEGPAAASSQEVATLPPLSATSDTPVMWSLVPDAQLRVDGRDLQRDDIARVTVDLGSAAWLQWDPNNLTIAGTPPAVKQTTPTVFMVPVTVTTASNSTVLAALPIRVHASPFGFAPSGAHVFAKPGASFTWNVPLADKMALDVDFAHAAAADAPLQLAAPPELTLDATWSPEASWLAFDASSRKLWGTPPASAEQSTASPSSIVVTLTARRRILAPVASLANTAKDVVYPAATTALVSRANVTLVLGYSSAHLSNGASSNRVPRILAVVLPFLAVLVGLVAWRFRRRIIPKNVKAPSNPLAPPQPKFEMFEAGRRSTFFGCAGLADSSRSIRADLSHDADSSTAYLVPGPEKQTVEVTVPLAAVTRNDGGPVFASERAGARNVNEQQVALTPPRRLGLMRMFRSLSFSNPGPDVERAHRAPTISSARSFPDLSSTSPGSSFSSSSSGFIHSPPRATAAPRSPPSIPRRRSDFRHVSDGIGRSLARANVEQHKHKPSSASSAFSSEDIIAEYADAVDATYHRARVVPVATAPLAPPPRMRTLKGQTSDRSIGAGTKADDVFSAGAGAAVTLSRSKRSLSKYHHQRIPTDHKVAVPVEEHGMGPPERLPPSEPLPLTPSESQLPLSSSLRLSTIRLITPPTAYGSKPRVAPPEVEGRTALELERPSEWLDMYRVGL